MTKCANDVIIESDMGIKTPRESNSEFVDALKASTRALLMATLIDTADVNFEQDSIRARIKFVDLAD